MVLSWKLYDVSQNKDVSLLKVLSCFFKFKKHKRSLSTENYVF